MKNCRDSVLLFSSKQYGRNRAFAGGNVEVVQGGDSQFHVFYFAGVMPLNRTQLACGVL